MKSGGLNLPESFGPLQACASVLLPFPLPYLSVCLAILKEIIMEFSLIVMLSDDPLYSVISKVHFSRKLIDRIP